MKKGIVLFFLIFAVRAELSPQNNTVQICKFCEFVYERSYFLLRLEKVITAIKLIDKSGHINTSCAEFHKAEFRHPRIKKLIIELEKSDTLSPFFNLWTELNAYKYISDESLIKEFTILTLFLIKQFYPRKVTQSQFLLPDVAITLKNGTYIEAVTLRTYIAQRIDTCMKKLEKIKCSKKSIFESSDPSDTNCLCIFESHSSFTHPDINRCITLMASHNSLKPLFNLVQEFDRFKCINDEQFNKEFLLLIFGVCKNLVTYHATIKNVPLKTATIELILHLYHNINSLPLEEILDAIDMIAEELPPILEKYELNHRMSWNEWKKWLKRYWWVPPGLLCIYGIRLALIFKGNTHHSPFTATHQRPYNRPTYFDSHSDNEGPPSPSKERHAL